MFQCQLHEFENANKTTAIEESMEEINEMHLALIKFTANAIETGNSEAVNIQLLSDLAAISQPSNQENEMNPESQNILHRSDLNTNASNDQQILNIHSPISHGYESATERQTLFDQRTSHTVHNNPENMRNLQGLQRNFESRNTAHCVDGSSRPRNDLCPSNWEMVNTAHLHNTKRNSSTCSMVTDNFQAHKRDREKIWGTSGQKVTTYSEMSSINYDFKSEKCVTNQMAFEPHRPDVIDHEFLNKKLCPFNNQRMQNLGDVDKQPFFTHGQSTETDIRISELSQNNTAPSMSSDSVASKRESFFTLDEVLAVPGQSGYIRNKNIPIGEKFQSFYKKEIPSKKGKEVKMLICRVCKAEIAKHAVEYGGKSLYECCICTYYEFEQVNLQKHSHSHLSEKFCNICEKELTEGDSHNNKKKCIVCAKEFQCRTQLNEHFLNHEYSFTDNCWGCSRCIDVHYEIGIRNRKLYVCCFCQYKTENKPLFKFHNNKHRPTIFCKICREEYPIEEKSSHTDEWNCIGCKERFKCRARFEEHYLDFEVLKITNEEKTFYKCCKCSHRAGSKNALKGHLFKCTGVKAFKCVICGKRFGQNNDLQKHSHNGCPAVPYKCEKCAARFPRSDFLDQHCSVKHKT